MNLDHNITYRKKDNGIQVIISYKLNNKWRQKSKQGFEDTRDGKKRAKAWALEAINELGNNISANIDLNFKDITFQEFTSIHIKHLSLRLQPKTLLTYKLSIKTYSDLNNLSMTKIKPYHIQKITDSLVERGLLHSTIRTYLSKIKAIFNAAITQYHLIAINPAYNIIFKAAKSSKEKKALNKTELNDLLKKLSNNPSLIQFYIMSLFASKCGMRLGEILGLTWNDIDFNSKTININKQWKLRSDGTHGFGPLKSKNSNRIIPLPASIIPSIVRYKELNIKTSNNRIIKYTSVNGAGSNIQKVYDNLGYNISIHELRHTYATNLVSANIDYKTAAKLLGHDVEMLMRVYSHVTDEMYNKAASIIDEIM